MPELDEKVKSANCDKKLLLPCHNFDDPFQSNTLLCYISLYIEMYIDDNLVGRLNRFKVSVVRDIMSVTRARLGTPFVPSYFSTRFIKCSFLDIFGKQILFLFICLCLFFHIFNTNF